MRIVPTHAHAVIDYLTGLLLIALPWLLGFAHGGIAQWLPVVLGLGIIASSLLTDYELGAMRLIPMPVHLALDGAAGCVFALAPWLFGFSDRVWLPFLLIGLFEVMVSLITSRTPADDPASAGGLV